MGKFSVKIESRRLYIGEDPEDVGELWAARFRCRFADDAEADNDFDIVVKSDASRFRVNTAYDNSEEVISNLKGTEIGGTRTSDTIFTRSSGTWNIDTIIGWWAYAYVSGNEESGGWYKVLDNGTDTITISGTLPVGCDSVKLTNRPALRHSISLIPPEGFYGSFFQYEVTKKIPANGEFKWDGGELEVIPRPGLDLEFLSATGSVENEWEQ
jgi:hypothetical protein